MDHSKRTLYFDPATHQCHLVDLADLEPQSIDSYAADLEKANYHRVANLVREWSGDSNMTLMEMVIKSALRDLGIQFPRWMQLKPGAEAVPVKLRHASDSLVYDCLVDKHGAQLITARFSLKDDFEIMALAAGLPQRSERPCFGAQRGLGSHTLEYGHPLLNELVDARNPALKPGLGLQFPTSWAG